MSFLESVRTCYAKYADFSGRSSRSEFWWFFLFAWIPSLVFVPLMLFVALGGYRDLFTLLGGAYALISIANMVPLYAAMTRRLHDTGRSGFYILVQFIPILGPFMLLVWLTDPGAQGQNIYDADVIITDYSPIQSNALGGQKAFVPVPKHEDWEPVAEGETGDVTCPACGHAGPLADGKCADCGLSLRIDDAQP